MSHRMVAMVFTLCVWTPSLAQNNPGSSARLPRTRQPVTARRHKVLLRAARIFDIPRRRENVQRNSDLKQLSLRRDWLRSDPSAKTAQEVNDLLGRMPTRHRLDPSDARRRHFGQAWREFWTDTKPAHLRKWLDTVSNVEADVKRHRPVADRVTRIENELHARMDRRYDRLGQKLERVGRAKPEALVKRAIDLIRVLDHQAHEREASGQPAGRGASLSTSSRDTLFSHTNHVDSSVWNMSQLLPASTAYTFNIRRPGTVAADRGYLPVEARRFVQMGLELSVIARKLEKARHPAAAGLSRWINHSTITFKGQGTNKYGPYTYDAGSFQLARPASDLVSNKAFLESGVVSPRLVRSLKRHPDLAADAGW